MHNIFMIVSKNSITFVNNLCVFRFNTFKIVAVLVYFRTLKPVHVHVPLPSNHVTNAFFYFIAHLEFIKKLVFAYVYVLKAK